MSTNDFYVHKIRKNDSLATVAKRLQIHPVDLKYFHNERCSISERVVFDHLQDLEKLFVPIDYKNNTLRFSEKSNERPAQNFDQNFYQKEYQVSEVLTDDNNSKKLVSYSILVDFEKNEDDNFILTFDRKDFRKNGKIPDDKLYEIAIKTQQSIFPLQFVLDKNGHPIRFYDFEKLLLNFKEKREEIEQDFIGDLTKEYLDLFENNLSNEAYALKQFTSTLLFQVIFINRKIFQTETIFQKKFYLVPNSFEINCKCEASYNHTDEKYVQTIIEGISIENYSMNEVLNGIKSDETKDDSSLYSVLHFEYKTDKRTKQLIEASADIQLVESEKQYKTYSLILKPTNQNHEKL